MQILWLPKSLFLSLNEIFFKILSETEGPWQSRLNLQPSSYAMGLKYLRKSLLFYIFG